MHDSQIPITVTLVTLKRHTRSKLPYELFYSFSLR